MTIPKIIHQTWKSLTLPEPFSTWSKTWHIRNWKHILWDDNDIDSFVKRYFKNEQWFFELPRTIMKVDAWRYMVLYVHGGVYVDLDFVRLKDINSYLSHDILLGKMGNDDLFEHSIPNAIMFSRPKHPFWLHVIENIKLKFKKGVRHVESLTGPVMLYSMAKKHKIPLAKSHVFYPLDWSKEQHIRKKMLKNTPDVEILKKKYPNSTAFTFWTHSW